MASDALYAALAEALSQPSRAYRTAKAALDIPNQALQGYVAGGDIADKIGQRKMNKQTLEEALQGNVPERISGYGSLPVTTLKNLGGLDAVAKLTESNNAMVPLVNKKGEIIGQIPRDAKIVQDQFRGRQFVGTQAGKGLIFDPNENKFSLVDLPTKGPVTPKVVTPQQTPFVDEKGTPLQFTPTEGYSTASVTGGGRPVPQKGNEQAITDAALMQTQIPNVDKLFDAYKKIGEETMGNAKARAQATVIGGFINPEIKQLENSLKLAAFTFGGKNLTGQEKQVVFGAFFPNIADAGNEKALEQKRNLLKDYFSGKIDLLQAANLLGPAGGALRGMLQSKVQNGEIQQDSSGNSDDPLGLLQ